MACEDLVILIPCHSLEDFPTELSEPEAASLLNAFSATWHPQLIAATGVIPRWHRADAPPEMVRGKLILVPEASRGQIPPDWEEQATADGATIVAAGEDRSELLSRLLEAFGGERTDLDAELVADSIALGTTHLLSELLMRAMRQYSILDEGRLQREAVAAAAAILSQDQEAARTRLRNCFDVLTESRERFYPVDCYLIDLCLVVPEFADDNLIRMLRSLKPTNLLVQGIDLEQIAVERPEVIRELKEAWERNTASLIGGEYRETPNSTRSFTHLLTEFERGREVFRKHLGKVPEIWGRRKFGLLPQIPQILKHFGYHGAMHLAMDDGLYPDEEFSKIRWTGTSGAYLDALTRIPLAAESASSFLRFASRMSESMDHDQVAAILFARWPEVKAPWFNDLRRMHNYCSALGRWTTLEDYFNFTDSAGRLSSYDVGDYLSPDLLHSVARRETSPIHRHVLAARAQASLDSARTFSHWTSLIRTGEITETPFQTEELNLDAIHDTPDLLQQLDDLRTQTAGQLLPLLNPQSEAPSQNLLIFNSLSFDRKILVQDNDAHHVVDVPGSGFASVNRTTSTPSTAPASPFAEGLTLRNGLFDLEINERTGGIARLKKPGRAPNRLSLQLAYRFPQERRLPPPDPSAAPIKSWYSRMEVSDIRTLSTGPVVGEIETLGRIVDQLTDDTLAHFNIRYQLAKNRPYLQIDIDLDVRQLPEGDPWSNYFAVRWAWNDSTAALTRSQLGQPHSFRLQRFEAPDFFEIASDSDRTTLLFGGLPFHRKTDDRMLDTLLVVEGETQRHFRLAVALDQPYPLRAASDLFTPPTFLPSSGNLTSGWLFHLDVKNVQILTLAPLHPEPSTSASEFESSGTPSLATLKRGCSLLIAETEGRLAQASIRCFRTPRSARKADATGSTIIDLPIEGDQVIVHLSAFETVFIELLFE